MSYLSLYQKYRPKNFKEIVGQSFVVNILKNAIKDNKIVNSYIFSGPKGTGKTSIAKIFANAINCLNNKDGDVCGKCEICNSFVNCDLIDVIELDAASNNGVDQIRSINDNIHFLPTKLAKKIYIIDEAHMLTTAAWNALLKTIENPPSFIIFIFATTEVHKIPLTIISRCQCLKFNRIPDKDIEKLLIYICQKEQIKFDEKTIPAITKMANGSVRDSLTILDQIATYSNNDIKHKDIYKIYGLLTNEEVVNFMNCFIKQDYKNCLKQLKTYYEQGIDLNNFNLSIINALIDKLIFLKTKDETCLTKFSLNEINIIDIASQNDIYEILDIWEKLYAKKYSQKDIYDGFLCAIIDSSKKISKNPPINNVILNTKIPPLFKFKDIEIESGKQIEKDEQKKDFMPTNEEILFAAFANKNNRMIDKIDKILLAIKNETIIDSNLSILRVCHKVACASKNCVVILFRDEIDANILNKNMRQNDFLLSCCKIFGGPLFFVGYTIDKINEYKEILLKKMKEKIKEPDLKILRDILTKDGSIEQIAYDTIYKFIKNDK